MEKIILNFKYYCVANQNTDYTTNRN